MHHEVIIFIRTQQEELRETPLTLRTDNPNGDQPNWQFSADGLSTGQLMQLLVCLESLDFRANE